MPKSGAASDEAARAQALQQEWQDLEHQQERYRTNDGQAGGKPQTLNSRG